MFTDKKKKGEKGWNFSEVYYLVEEATENNGKKIEKQWETVRENTKYILERQCSVTRETDFLWC